MAMTTKTVMLVALVLAGVLVDCQRLSSSNDVTAELLEVGAFVPGPGQPGTRETNFISHGDVIVPRLGTGFGFRFKLNNVPADSIELKTFVTHPPIKQRSGETETRYAVLTTIPAKNGSAISVTGYTFDRPDEMTPGVWTFVHVYRGRTLIQQSFTVREANAQPNSA